MADIEPLPRQIDAALNLPAVSSQAGRRIGPGSRRSGLHNRLRTRKEGSLARRDDDRYPRAVVTASLVPRAAVPRLGRPVSADDSKSLTIAAERVDMIILGILLLILGFVLKIAILWTIGIIVLIVGLVLLLLGATGRAVGGRRHYW